jgi:hypothetical protein
VDGQERIGQVKAAAAGYRPKKSAPGYQPKKSAPGRVTRLGEFSPVGRLFTSLSSLKFIEGDHIFGLLNSTVKFMHYFGK